MKCEGIQGIRRLAKHHPDVLSLHLHTVTLAIIAEVSNVNQGYVVVSCKTQW